MTWPKGAWPEGRSGGDADVVILGDSITQGQSSTDWLSRAYAGRLRSALRSRYGDGGSGFTPHWANNVGVVTGGTATSEFSSTVPNGNVCLLSGTRRLRVVAEGTTVSLFLRRAAGDGTAQWRIDGGAWTSVPCTGAPGHIRAVAEGLYPGPHIVEVEAVSGTIGVAGAEGRNVTGCRVHIMGLGGRTSGGNAYWGATGETSTAFRSASISRWAPHLLIINLGVNDSNSANTTPAAFKTNIAGHIEAARIGRSDCDVVLVANHLGRFADNGYDAMRAALPQLADTYGAVVVDLEAWARTLPNGTTTARTAVPPTGTSWGRWTTWGWWGTVVEAVHPGDAGHFVIADLLEQLVIAPELGPPPEPSDGGDLIELGGILT